MPIFINNQRLARLAGVDFDSEEIRPGPLVYSRTHTIAPQFGKLQTFPPCILITSFSDTHVTPELVEGLPSNVRRWFSNNVSVDHPRVQAVPIGLRTSPEGEGILRAAIARGRLPERNLVYMNFWRQFHRRPHPRSGLYETFGGQSWITTEGGFEHVPMDIFYEQMASHPFIMSPPGAGDDCHRHWESILLGSIPIVLRSPVTRLLDELPCLQIDDWGEVTEERLSREKDQLMARFQSPAMERIWFEYWEARIREA